ncbi:MAG: DUF2156 domain-containing protein [Clostridiales bacterium]|jgi:hypothetical protein|nr:DUF2156 domain-containing protein [Clostridiales bacterium]
MLHFRKVTERDFIQIDAYYREYANWIYSGAHRICDYAPGTIKMWHQAYDMEYAFLGNNLYFSAVFDVGSPRSYLYPLGPDDKEALSALREHIQEKGSGKLSVVPQECVGIVEEVFEREHIIENSLRAERAWADYIYLKRDFENPTGRKHHRQKNLINRFVRENPEYTCEAIYEKNAPQVLAYFQKYALRNSDTSPVDGLEFPAVCRILQAPDFYGMQGMLLRTEGEICGFTIGEVYKDTVFVHVEKADKERAGAFQVLSRDFQRSIAGAALYVNREEDLGLEGLRQSKLSYGPIRLDYKYTVEIQYAKNTDKSSKTLFL